MGPYDLKVTDADIALADAWWCSLSINQMKAHVSAYAPTEEWARIRPRTIHQIWEEEGKPSPEEHVHVWGPLEQSRLAGMVYCKCKIDGCRSINLDPFSDVEDED